MRKFIPLIAVAGLLLLPATTHAATSTLTVTGGSLSLTGAAVGNFTATLTGADQKVDTSLGSYTASDSTGSGNGWNITFQATQFTCTSPTTGNVCPSGSNTLPLNSLMMPVPTVACATGTACSGGSLPPTIKITSTSPLDTGSATALKVASAAVGQGMGTYNFTPATIGTGNLELAVPSSAYATTYTSTVTISQIAGP